VLEGVDVLDRDPVPLCVAVPVPEGVDVQLAVFVGEEDPDPV
jgi:hypothetical protein